MREVDDQDEFDDHQQENVDLSSKQIAVQSFDLGGANIASKSMVQKRTQSAIGGGIGGGIGSGIGSGIGGGLRKPTQLKPPSTSQNNLQQPSAA